MAVVRLRFAVTSDIRNRSRWLSGKFHGVCENHIGIEKITFQKVDYKITRMITKETIKTQILS